ncbi:hypothetical protein [Pseudomonas caspiana]|uniref:Uncharacterized protein n=1 Tax=Pseudomonas caspiana TaxID=1451454 RepID=A0A1Y3P235_9PSED|nr:hypothetical protein [Pseudomonas caspiana]OUM73886.1 hypothetical protein AUC60_10555 [Pseudomonas caspiana]
MAVAKTIADSVLGELNSFSSRHMVPDPFTTARLRREIAKLENVDVPASLLCEAILLTLEKKYEDVVSTFETIFEMLPEEADMHENFGNSLARLGRVADAHDAYLNALKYSNEPTSILMELAATTLVTFGTDEFMDALNNSAEKSDTAKILNSEFVSEAIKLHGLFEELEVSPSAAKSVYRSAEKVCLAFDKKINSGRFMSLSSYGGARVAFYAGIVGTAEIIADMNFALADQLIDDEQGDLLSMMSFVYIPANQESLVDMESQHAYFQ